MITFNTTNKDFNKELEQILSALKNGENFAFSKYADGEYAIMRNERITNCDNWTFNPSSDQKYRNELLKSFRFKDDGYYVGISCPCCVSQDDVNWMRENVGAKPENLTWANIFVNGNYNYFKENIISEFDNKKIILVANQFAMYNKLPFKINEFIPVTGTAWKDNFDLISRLSNRFDSGKLYLFCAGPLGNMLAAEMWRCNKNNTYLDIGSTLNPWLVGANRGYLRGAETINKKCIW